MDKFKSLLIQKTKELISRQGHPFNTGKTSIRYNRMCSTFAKAQEMEWAELRGEELRLAMQSLGRLTGAVGVEDLLDTIFGQFCIGK